MSEYGTDYDPSPPPPDLAPNDSRKYRFKGHLKPSSQHGQRGHRTYRVRVENISPRSSIRDSDIRTLIGIVYHADKQGKIPLSKSSKEMPLFWTVDERDGIIQLLTVDVHGRTMMPKDRSIHPNGTWLQYRIKSPKDGKPISRYVYNNSVEAPTEIQWMQDALSRYDQANVEKDHTLLWEGQKRGFTALEAHGMPWASAEQPPCHPCGWLFTLQPNRNWVLPEPDESRAFMVKGYPVILYNPIKHKFKHLKYPHLQHEVEKIFEKKPMLSQWLYWKILNEHEGDSFIRPYHPSGKTMKYPIKSNEERRTHWFSISNNAGDRWYDSVLVTLEKKVKKHGMHMKEWISEKDVRGSDILRPQSNPFLGPGEIIEVPHKLHNEEHVYRIQNKSEESVDSNIVRDTFHAIPKESFQLLHREKPDLKRYTFRILKSIDPVDKRFYIAPDPGRPKMPPFQWWLVSSGSAAPSRNSLPQPPSTPKATEQVLSNQRNLFPAKRVSSPSVASNSAPPPQTPPLQPPGTPKKTEQTPRTSSPAKRYSSIMIPLENHPILHIHRFNKHDRINPEHSQMYYGKSVTNDTGLDMFYHEMANLLEAPLRTYSHVHPKYAEYKTKFVLERDVSKNIDTVYLRCTYDRSAVNQGQREWKKLIIPVRNLGRVGNGPGQPEDDFHEKWHVKIYPAVDDAGHLSIKNKLGKLKWSVVAAELRKNHFEKGVGEWTIVRAKTTDDRIHNAILVNSQNTRRLGISLHPISSNSRGSSTSSNGSKKHHRNSSSKLRRPDPSPDGRRNSRQFNFGGNPRLFNFNPDTDTRPPPPRAHTPQGSQLGPPPAQEAGLRVTREVQPRVLPGPIPQTIHSVFAFEQAQEAAQRRKPSPQTGTNRYLYPRQAPKPPGYGSQPPQRMPRPPSVRLFSPRPELARFYTPSLHSSDDDVRSRSGHRPGKSRVARDQTGKIGRLRRMRGLAKAKNPFSKTPDYARKGCPGDGLHRPGESHAYELKVAGKRHTFVLENIGREAHQWLAVYEQMPASKLYSLEMNAPAKWHAEIERQQSRARSQGHQAAAEIYWQFWPIMSNKQTFQFICSLRLVVVNPTSRQKVTIAQTSLEPSDNFHLPHKQMTYVVENPRYGPSPINVYVSNDTMSKWYRWDSVQREIRRQNFVDGAIVAIIRGITTSPIMFRMHIPDKIENYYLSANFVCGLKNTTHLRIKYATMKAILEEALLHDPIVLNHQGHYALGIDDGRKLMIRTVGTNPDGQWQYLPEVPFHTEWTHGKSRQNLMFEYRWSGKPKNGWHGASERCFYQGVWISNGTSSNFYWQQIQDRLFALRDKHALGKSFQNSDSNWTIRFVESTGALVLEDTAYKRSANRFPLIPHKLLLSLRWLKPHACLTLCMGNLEVALWNHRKHAIMFDESAYDQLYDKLTNYVLANNEGPLFSIQIGKGKEPGYSELTCIHDKRLKFSMKIREDGHRT